MKKESLTTEEKQQVSMLAAQGLSNNAIALRIGRSPHTTKKELAKPETQVQVQNIQDRLADKFEQLSERILDAVCDADLEKASLQQKAISAGVMLDKSRLLRGQATSHVAVMFAAIERACSNTGDG